MRSQFALSIVSLAILATASGCASTHEDGKENANDVSIGTPKPNGAATSNAPVTGTTVVTGTFAEPSVALDNAQALAIADDQTTYTAPLDAHGNFSLSVPAGSSYRIVFANQLAGGGQVKIGTLSFKSGDQIVNWFGANAPGTLDLGIILGAGNGGPSTADHANDPSTSTDSSRTPSGPKNADGTGVQLGGANVCLIWPSVDVYTGVDIGSAWADANANAHLTANPTQDDDKNCANWTGAARLPVWGAPWSIDSSRNVTLAGGKQIPGGISGGANAKLGFGTGFYGGFFTKASEGFSIGGSFGVSGGISVGGLGGIGAGLGGALNNAGAAINGAITTVVADADGAVSTAATDADGAVQTAIADVDGTVQSVVTEADGSVQTIVKAADGTIETIIKDANGVVQTVEGALASVSIGNGIVIGASVGVIANVDFTNGWAVGVGAGFEGGVCLTSDACGTALSCVSNSCQSR